MRKELFLTREQVKELCAIMHNGKTEEERKSANGELVMNFKVGLVSKCRKILEKMSGGDIDLNKLDELVSVGIEVLTERAWNYDPENKNGANLLTYCDKWLINAFYKATNEGLTENEIKNLCKVHKAIKSYEAGHDAIWTENEGSVKEISALSGLSVKVVRKTLVLYYSRNSLSYDSLVEDKKAVESESSFISYKDSFMDKYDLQRYRSFLNSLSSREYAVLETMVDIEDNYKPISEREGIRLLEKKGISIGRGTLKNEREHLKSKVWNFLHDENYEDDFGSLAA